MECTLYFQAGTNELGRIAEIEKQNPREAKEATLFHAMRDSLANPLEEPVGTAFPPGIQDGANDCPILEEAIGNMHLMTAAPELYADCKTR